MLFLPRSVSASVTSAQVPLHQETQIQVPSTSASRFTSVKLEKQSLYLTTGLPSYAKKICKQIIKTSPGDEE